MSQEMLNMLIGVLGSILTGLVGWAFFLLRAWINKKFKDQEEVKLLSEITMIIEDGICEVNQIFVESLKKTGKFDEEAQKKAKELCMGIINGKLNDAMKALIEKLYGNVNEYISGKIEALIYTMKPAQ